MRDAKSPLWLREFDRVSRFKPVVVFSGNVRDWQVWPSLDSSKPWGSGHSLVGALLGGVLHERGYERVYSWDRVDGFTFGSHMEEAQAQRDLEDASSPDAQPTRILAAPQQDQDSARPLDTIRTLLDDSSPTAVVVDFSSQLTAAADELSDAHRDAWMRLLKAGMDSEDVTLRPLGTAERAGHNLLILVCDKLADLPQWMHQTNPDTASVVVGLPQPGIRRSLIARELEGDRTIGEKDLAELTRLTEGMNVREVEAILREIQRQRDLGADALRPTDVVHLFKYGLTDSPWEEPERRQAISDGVAVIEQTVRGQRPAVRAVVEVLKRSVTGTSGVQHSSNKTKPRGVLFFAGHTGVGKTEMAKAIARTVFGDDAEPLRYDMGEFGSEFAAQRLVGAPPGYVGYSAGGELTERMKENPFRVILLDEIEKAHPSLLNTFLGILEDGRLTDGLGQTVYFQDSIIIFTSNRGAFVYDLATGKPAVAPGTTDKPLYRVPPDTDKPYADVQRAFMEGVEQFFTLELGRPELLSRIGRHNVVVFDVIRDLSEVLDTVLERVRKHVLESNRIQLSWSDDVRMAIAEAVAPNRADGGRGVANMVELALVNPLSMKLFDYLLANGDVPDDKVLRVHIEALQREDEPDPEALGGGWTLQLSPLVLADKPTVPESA